MAVYDKDNENTQKSLGASALNAAEEGRGFSNGSFDTAEEKEQKALAKNDESLSSGFDKLRGQAGKSRLSRAKFFFFGSKGRTALTSIGIGGGVLGGIIGILLTVMPALKINGLVDMAERSFFSNTQQIGDNIAERMMSQYISQKLIPGMVTNQCVSSKVDSMCAKTSPDDTYVGKLYNAWRDGKIEKKLYDKYGLEITREGNRWYVNSNDMSQRVSLGDFDNPNDSGQQSRLDNAVRTALTRTEARKAVKSAFEGETGWKNMHLRYQAAKLLERKYGIARCLVACGSRDKAKDWIANNPVNDRLKAGKSFILQRTVGSYNETLALAIECASDRNFACLDIEGNTPEGDGTRNSKYTNELRSRVAAAQSKYGSEKLEEILKKADLIRDKNGMSGYIIESVMEKLLGKTVGSLTAKAVPFVGWVDLAVTAQGAGQNASTVYKNTVYAANSLAMVNTFAMYALANDEVKAADMDLETFGSISQTLDANPNTENGGLGAEASPAYRAFAGTANGASSSYSCKDGKNMDGNSLVCSTGESLKASESTGATLLDLYTTTQVWAADIPLMNGVSLNQVSQGWNMTVGWLMDRAGEAVGWVLSNAGGAANTVIKGLTGLDLEAWLNGVVANAVNFMMEMVAPPVVTTNSSGSRLANATMGGAAVLAQDTCKSMGCQTISAEEYGRNSIAYLEQEREEFNNKSVIARLFDTDESQSLISQVAMNNPMTSSGFISNISRIASINPISLVGDSISNITTEKSYAASASTYATYFSELGLTPYGYKADDPVLNSDNYEEYEKENDCSNPESEINRQWDQSGVEGYNPETGQFEYTKSNGCMALRSMACSMGGVYDDKLCADPVKPTEAAPETPGGGTTDGSFGTSTDMRALAQQILANPNISLNTGFDNPRRQMQNLAAGTNSSSCNISPYVLNMLLYIAQNHTIYITSINRYCAGMQTASGNYSFHWKGGGGHAVDIGIVDGVKSTGGSAKDLALLREIIPMLPSGAEVGQVQCRPAGSAGPLPAGVIEFRDSCNHIHIALPVYAY